MMRDTSLDEQAGSEGMEKSLAMGSISFSQHRQSVHLHRDVNTPADTTRSTVLPDPNTNTVSEKSRNGVCSRNETNETRTSSDQSRVSEEEKKQEETSTPTQTKVQTRILPPQQAQAQTQPQQRMPHQDYLRHVTTDGSKRAGTSWWERVVVQRSSYVVEDLVEQYTADSQFLHSDPFSIAWLDRIELETGDLLGSGTYSNVSRVQKLEILPEFLKDHPEQSQLRKELVARSIKNKGGDEEESTGYAIKHLKSELLQNSKLFEAAAADLIMEAKFLARLSHPNILRLRGMALGGSSAFATTGLFDSYFLVVDELEETLIQRIQMWKIQGSTDQYQHNMILYKLKLAVQVASALAYLHERRLVFRDLKPHNIGLRKDGTVQLFDFGFCRELPDPSSSVCHQGSRSRKGQKQSVMPPEQPPASSDNPDNESDEEKLFCMSGKGTLLYMASEVLSSRCYNQKADVYSWSMVCYELLTLQKPFAVASIEQHKKVVCDRGVRPPLHHLRWLSPGVKELLQHSWQADVQARWHMKDVKDALDDIIAELERTRPSFSRSQSSFGANDSSKSYFCQGGAMEGVVLDITSGIQTRYQYITNKIFCMGATKDAASTQDISSTAALASEPSARIAQPAIKLNASIPEQKSETSKVSFGEDSKTKTNKVESEKTLETDSGKQPSICSTSRGKDEHKEDVLPKRTIPTYSNIWGTTSSKAAQRTGHKRESLAYSGIWGTATATRRIKKPQRSEHFDPSMCSISMHSERLNAARHRQAATGSSSSPRHSMASHDMNGSVSLSSVRGTTTRVASHSSSEVGIKQEPGSFRRPRRSSLSSLGETREEGESLENTDQDGDKNNHSYMLQTIQSEDTEKSMDDVDIDDNDDSKPQAIDESDAGSRSICLPPPETSTKGNFISTIPEEVSESEGGSQSIGLPKTETQTVSTADEATTKDADPSDENKMTSTIDEKKEENPQDDNGRDPEAFIAAVASV